MTDNAERPYLMLLNITEPQPEHAKIKSVLDQISDNTAKAIYFDKHSGGFVFTSKLKPRQIYSRFDQTLMSSDRCIILELGEEWFTHGYENASGWFQKYLNDGG